MVINHPLSASSIYYNPWHPPCSIYVPDSLFAQSLSNAENNKTTNFERGKHDAEFSVLQMRLHQVINEVNLGGQMLDT